MWPQIVMAVLIIYSTMTSIVSMTRNGDRGDWITSIVAAFVRSLTVAGVLWWGDFWRI